MYPIYLAGSLSRHNAQTFLCLVFVVLNFFVVLRRDRRDFRTLRISLTSSLLPRSGSMTRLELSLCITDLFSRHFVPFMFCNDTLIHQLG